METPIVCSNKSVMPHILGEDAVYFDPENPMSIAKAIKRMIDDPTLAQKSSSDASERLELFFDKNGMPKTVEYLEQVVEKNGE